MTEELDIVENQLEDSQKREGNIDNLKKKTSLELVDLSSDGKVNKKHISLVFQSSDSNLSEEEKKEINEILGEEQVKARIYFIRHGKSVEDKGDGNIQSSEAELTEGAKIQFQGIGDKLKEIGINSENSYLLFDEGTEEEKVNRIIESGEEIRKKIGWKKDRIDKKVKGLDTTDKEDESKTRRSIATALQTMNCTEELVLKLDSVENINVVCVIHKSNIGAIKQYLFNKNKPISISHEGVKNGEIYEVDVKIDGEVVDLEKEKNLLNISSYNYDSNLFGILEQEEELKNYIARFKRGEMQIWELQNLVNVYFMKDSKLFEKYLLSKNRELRIFCISNLLIEGEFDKIEKYIGRLLVLEKETEIVNFIDTILSVCTEKERKILLEIVVKKRGVVSGIKLGKLEYWANYEKYVNENIEYIRNKSLDERLKKGENVIVPLELSYASATVQEIKEDNSIIMANGKKFIPVKGNTRVDISQTTYLQKVMDAVDRKNDIFILLDFFRINLIEGEAGAGKSIKLLEIMEYLRPKDNGENKYFPVYIDLGEFNYARIEGEIERQTSNLYGKGKYKFVYLFDGLDEANYDNKLQKKFFKKLSALRKNGGKVVVTSRINTLYNEISNSKDRDLMNIEKISLKSLDEKQIEEYISNHLSEEQKSVWKNWKEKEFIKGIESNPLMLSILCNLLISGDNIEDIDNIVKLYDKITDNRLKVWEKSKEGRLVNKNTVPFRKDLLSKIAYESLFLEKKINYKYIIELIEPNYQNIIPYTDDLGYDLECLNMLFRGNKKGEYNFIHESFREYFTAKFISKKIADNTLDYEYYFYNLKNININFLDMLIDLLDNSSIEKLIVYIKNNEDYFPIAIQNSILYLLGRLDRESMLTYLKYIYIDDKIINILGKIGGEENIKLIKSFGKIYNNTVDEKIIEVLGKIGGEENIEFIKTFKNARTCFTRAKMIRVLGRIGGEKNIEFIKTFKKDEDKMVKLVLAETLYGIGGKDNIAFLEGLKGDVVSYIKDKLGRDENTNIDKEFLSELFFYQKKLKTTSFKIEKYLVSIKTINSKLFSLRENNISELDVLEEEKNFLKETLDLLLEKKKLIEETLNVLEEKKNLLEKNIFQLTLAIEKRNFYKGKTNLENIKFLKSFRTDSIQSFIDLIVILGKIGGKENIEYIKSFNNTRSIEKKEIVIEVLGQMGGEDNINFIKGFGKDKNPKVKSAIIEVLGKIGGEDNISFIKKYKNDNSSYVRGRLISILRRIGGRENIKFIKTFKNDESEFVIFSIIESLGRIGGKENINFIKRFGNSENIAIVEKLIKVLGKIGGEENIKFIRSYGNYEIDYIREIVIVVLGGIGGRKNIEFIKSFVNDESSDVRNKVKTILRIYGKNKIISFSQKKKLQS